MGYTFLPPDGIVKGSIENQAGTKAVIWLNLSFYNAAPSGAFYIKILTKDKTGLLNRYSISSNCPVQIKTLHTEGVNSVKANFKNTITFNTGTKETLYRCQTLFTATQTQPGTWDGALRVVYPDGRKLSVYGQFQGSVTVNRQVSCVTPGP